MTLAKHSVPSLLESYLSQRVAKFWRRVDRTGDCWVYLGGRNLGGYGVFPFADRSLLAHRFSYEIEVGPIPHGLGLDHLCRNRSCVRPSHLEPVSNQENFSRGDQGAGGRRSAAKTHCPQGHPYDEANTYVWAPSGHRLCRACGRARSARARTSGECQICGKQRGDLGKHVKRQHPEWAAKQP